MLWFLSLKSETVLCPLNLNTVAVHYFKEQTWFDNIFFHAPFRCFYALNVGLLFHVPCSFWSFFHAHICLFISLLLSGKCFVFQKKKHICVLERKTYTSATDFLTYFMSQNKLSSFFVRLINGISLIEHMLELPRYPDPFFVRYEI